MQKIHSELRRAIKNNKLIIFAGSGASISCGFPDWKNLVIEILKRIDQEQGKDTYKHFIPLLDDGVVVPLQVLDVLEANGYKRHVLAVLTDSLNLTSESRLELHKKIIQLTSKVITTNYDRAFEQAWGLAPKVIHNNDPFNLLKLRDADEYLFKVHGDIEHPFDCILFEKQYKDLYAKEIFWIGFMNLLVNYTVLFVGFSLSDPYVNNILFKIKEMFSGLTNKHFIITADKDIEHQLADIIIPIHIDRHEDLIKVLDDLIPVISNLPIRTYSKFIRTDKVVETIKRLKENQLVVTIKGEPGAGKKSLALEVGYACIQKSNIAVPDRVRLQNIIWITCTDLNENLPYVSSLYDIIGRSFDSEKVTKLSEEDKWKKEWEVYKLLQENRTLIIFDNFECIRHSEDILRWVQTLPDTCRVIINCTRDIPIPSAKVELDVLSRKEAIQLIKDEIGGEVHLLQRFSEDDLTKLYFYTKGRLRELQLTAGQIKQGAVNMDAIRRATTEGALDELHSRIWDQQLSDNSKKFLLLISIFSNVRSIEKEALHTVCNYAGIDFESASKECDSFNLLMIIDENIHHLYLIPPQSRTFIQEKLDAPAKDEIECHWITYFVEFIRKHVLRDEPKEDYWNSLVSEKMSALDNQWNGINEVLNWASKSEKYDSLVIDMANLLVHYMDSRFYNQQRLILVHSAIHAAERLNKNYERALFLIDALGWTYIEESSFKKAKEVIGQGLMLAAEIAGSDKLRSDDLFALGYAWLSRAEIELDNTGDAFVAIRKALKYKRKAYIRYRVYMAAGDICVHEKKFDEALKCYESAKRRYDSYKGEGQDYQINPRIAFAYLQNNKMAEAKEIFLKQINKDIPIGNLYAEYGLALINYKIGKREEAVKKLDDIERDIYRRASSNVLLKLIRAFRQGELSIAGS